MSELTTLASEVLSRGDQLPEEKQNGKKFLNYKDCRPAASAKRVIQKQNGNKTSLNPPPAQQQLMTNQLIAEKL